LLDKLAQNIKIKQHVQIGKVGTFWYIFMNDKEKLFSKKSAPSQASRMVETIYGCKWSLTIYQMLAHGVNRPGEMVRLTEGLSTKVLNQCLRKNIEFGILERISFNEIPPRVEYRVTEFGYKFMAVLDALETLQIDLQDELESQLESGVENDKENPQNQSCPV